MSDALKGIHPNDLARINPPESVVDKANWPSDSRRELLKRMLEASLDVTIPTPGLLKAFEQPLTVEAFSSLITMDPTPLGDIENDFEDSRYQKSHVFNLAPETKSSEELLDMRNAHRAMSILTAEQPQLNVVLRTKPFEIIAPMFRAFRTQNSRASVFHLCKVIDIMLKMNPEAVLTYLTGPRLKLCLQGLLANLHCSAVVDTVFNLITIRCSLENGLRPDTLKAYHKKQGHSNPIGTISGFVVSPDTSVALRIGSADLILRLLVHFDSIPLEPPNDSDLGESFLFKSLLNGQFLEGLAQTASRTDEASDSALMLFAALCKLAAKGKLATTTPIAPVEDEDDKPKPAVPENQKPGGRRRLKDFVPPPQAPGPKEDRLTKLGNELKSSLKTETISTACAKALTVTEVTKDGDSSTQKQKHTSYECARPFTYRRLEWLRVMNHLLELDYQIAVPWKSLVAWQQQYPQNSMLQNEFAKALQTILTTSVSADECKPAVVDCKLVSLLIKRAKEYDTDHAHAVKCLNLLRLKAELMPKQHWLSQYLKSHTTWIEFLPELKRQTQVILEPWLNELPSGANPVVPNNPKVDSAVSALNALFLSDPDNPLTAVARQTSQELADQEKAQIMLDLDLGSRYAKSLGFTSNQPITLPAVTEKSTNAANDGAPAAQGGGEKRKSGAKKKKKH